MPTPQQICCAAGICCAPLAKRAEAISECLQHEAGLDKTSADSAAAYMLENFGVVPKSVAESILAAYAPHFAMAHGEE